ncbi:MAG: ATP-binding protein [Treponema sp.]|jgi:predicted ATP-binding protein involved in virulence|nr:ATP-binding protein [Treponema sp.]
MEKYIERITGTIPHTNKTVDITLNGQNLIVTGANGSGKTSFLRSVYEKTVLLVAQKRQADLPKLKNKLRYSENTLSQQVKGTTSYDQWLINVSSQKREIENIETGVQIIIPDNIGFSVKYDDKKAVLGYFEDKRLADITEAKTAQGLRTEIEENQKLQPGQNIGNKLEQHLLNLKTRRSLAITEDNNQQLANTIDKWFFGFEENLKKLLEDNSSRLVFDSNRNKFSIRQDSKPPYTFQTLSTGYKAIFDIYADLIMRTEYFEVSPEDLQGVVFIDEIDSHLHVSLQRLILPFFTDSFPQIQFLVTTHSPFVLASMRDTLIYDLGKEEPQVIAQAKSQNDILNEFLGVPVAMPIWAEQSLNTILSRYLAAEPDIILLDTLKKELKEAGLEEFFPETMAKILEAK